MSIEGIDRDGRGTSSARYGEVFILEARGRAGLGFTVSDARRKVHGARIITKGVPQAETFEFVVFSDYLTM